MPRRDDLRTILLIGSGPIVIGQACEFDYSGTQAVKALREEGYRVVLVNSNPATIMTDPELADRTYVEPITTDVVEQIIAREKPEALLPTVGGQTALNCAMDLVRQGVLERYGVQLIGANAEAIERAEDRARFRDIMTSIGLETPPSGTASTLDEAQALLKMVGFPAIIRPAFTLGGSGGNIAFNVREYEEQCAWGLRQSPIRQILVERSVLGWKEFELEVMRDRKDNVVIICSIENIDPMGVHTGDSITVAPAMTLTDKEYQRMRDAALRVIRAVGVDTGGSNIQFAVNPADGQMVVIEMNPRVSRSSALASKATGFPIAKIAAKLAVGYSLDELPNDITRQTRAAFEPSIDYVVVKVPRFAFEKFPGADDTLTTQMKSVGEVMAIGRTFQEALHKATRSLENGRYGLDSLLNPGPAQARRLEPYDADVERFESALSRPTPGRLWQIGDAFRVGFSVERVAELTHIDPWFLHQIRDLVLFDQELLDRGREAGGLGEELLRRAKRRGFSDRRIGHLAGTTEEEVRRQRLAAGVVPTYGRVDTCAGEFAASTPYLYSTYETLDEARPTDRRKVVILGGGPNRIGQGIEFDYCCVHAALALREIGVETVMVNCNPETVSTDYDTSDRLYFEPVTLEDVMHIVAREGRAGADVGVIVQFGGQTPLKLAVPLQRAGVRVLGTPPDAIDRAEDRERFAELLRKLDLRQPVSGTARNAAEAREVAARIGYPVMVRPSYVLGGRAMQVVHDPLDLLGSATLAQAESDGHPILIDQFLKDAVEVDVDALCDGRRVVIGAVMEHIEEAGVHSGDSACSIPPFSLDDETVAEIERQAALLALELGVVGLMNVQFAVRGGEVYVLEVNPRASRTVPFVGKATGVPLAKIATRLMAGATLDELGVGARPKLAHMAVKEAVFVFQKFPGVDVLLGPEMRSTGEVMGIDDDFAAAFAKSQLAAGITLPASGRVFISVRDEDKGEIIDLARRMHGMGFEVLATRGTWSFLRRAGVPAARVNKVKEGHPHIVDRLIDGEVHMVVNTTVGAQAVKDSFSIRREGLMAGIPYFTTVEAAMAAVTAIERLRGKRLGVKSLQEYFGRT
ncbi:MAG TPA: carbamoyl-phosphate synthase large subunit [Myxococcota bacterium]|nr:carbamoyl-phosphate synthase large subunit [Myxococcota bacterium]